MMPMVRTRTENSSRPDWQKCFASPSQLEVIVPVSFRNLLKCRVMIEVCDNFCCIAYILQTRPAKRLVIGLKVSSRRPRVRNA